jgi:hypothetical protein
MDSPVRVIGMHRLPQRDATLEAVTRVSRTALLVGTIAQRFAARQLLEDP